MGEAKLRRQLGLSPLRVLAAYNTAAPTGVSKSRRNAEVPIRAVEEHSSPDPQLKGRFDGNCNITDCQKPIKDHNWWNSSTRAYYCHSCSVMINYWSKRDHGIIICTPVDDPGDQTAYPG